MNWPSDDTFNGANTIIDLISSAYKLTGNVGFVIRRSGSKQNKHGIIWNSAASVTVITLHIGHICDIMYIYFDAYIVISLLQYGSTERISFFKNETKVSELI